MDKERRGGGGGTVARCCFFFWGGFHISQRPERHAQNWGHWPTLAPPHLPGHHHYHHRWWNPSEWTLLTPLAPRFLSSETARWCGGPRSERRSGCGCGCGCGCCCCCCCC